MKGKNNNTLIGGTPKHNDDETAFNHLGNKGKTQANTPQQAKTNIRTDHPREQQQIRKKRHTKTKQRRNLIKSFGHRNKTQANTPRQANRTSKQRTPTK